MVSKSPTKLEHSKKTGKAQSSAITRTMTMGEILQKLPGSADIMMGFGLQCIGCSVNVFESLEEGARGHGMTEESIEEMVSDLNEYAREYKARTKERGELMLTEVAAEKIKMFAEKEGKKGFGLRIEVTPGGCAGYQYFMDFKKEPEHGDKSFNLHGVSVFIPENCIDMVRGSVVDFVDSIHGSGFKVDNPNAERSCGCGNSFG